MLFVPVNIFLKFSQPILCIRRWGRSIFATRMTMPETTSHLHHSFVLGKNYIGMSREILNVKPEPESVSVKERTYKHLRFCVSRPDTAHVPASMFFCQRIHVWSFLEFEIPEGQYFVFPQGFHHFGLFVSNIFCLCQSKKFKCR